MQHAHRITKPPLWRVALRVAGHLVAAFVTVVGLWAALTAFLLVASAAIS